MSYDGNMDFDKHTPQIDKEIVTANRRAAMLYRLQSVCLDVLDWAEAQDEERRPEWVDRLTQVMEDKT